ncbi:hypothetical protein SB57_05265 [Lactobacillus delbrueckii subsp. bulgaricus]|nr:hypothetical protein SB57_05265 [Lactobacillus delbrueckii subsp. bulgaricus]
MFSQLAFVKAPALNPDVKPLAIFRSMAEGFLHFTNTVNQRRGAGCPMQGVSNILGVGVVVDQT